MPLPTDMTTPAVAQALGCTPPTVRKLFEDGHLAAQVERRGERTYLTFAGFDVQSYLDAHGRFRKRGGTALVDEVAALRAIVDRIESAGALDRGGSSSRDAGARERVVALEEVVHLQRAAMAANREAEESRARATSLLLEAVREMESVDDHRRAATAALEEAVGALTNPGSIQGIHGDGL